MADKQDYKAWYYIPVPKETQELKQEFLKEHGSPGYDSKFVRKQIIFCVEKLRIKVNFYLKNI